MKIVSLCLSLFVLSINVLADTRSDIKKVFGSVPGFMKKLPEESLEGTWQDMKAIQFSQTSIPLKYKELIGLAVAAGRSCSSCIYFHTKLARFRGAEERQIEETLAIAGFTARWGAVLKGNQTDLQAFKNDVNKMHELFARKKNMQAMEVSPVEDPYQDIKATLGFVPSFLQNYPKAAVGGVWKEMKILGLNGKTSIPAEYRHLIGLAVSSKISCEYCSYYHTQSALMLNAKKEQLQEAVAMAGITELWGTVLSGHNYDNVKFRDEVDYIIQYMRTKKVDDSPVL